MKQEELRPSGTKRTNGEHVLVRPLCGIKLAGHHPFGTKSCERRACPRQSDTRNQVSRNSSIWPKSQEGELVLVCPVQVIKQVGLRLSISKSLERRACTRLSSTKIQASWTTSFGTMSRERRACPRLSVTRNHAGGTSSIWYEVARKEGLFLSIQYEKSSRRDFVRLVRSCENGALVLVHLVRGIK